MKSHSFYTEADMKYEAAHKKHYVDKDIRAAFDLYCEIIDTHPTSRAAAFSREQVRNLLDSVVPKDELFNAKKNLARQLLERMKV